MKKLAVATMIGLSLLVGGCGNNDVQTTQQVKQVCEYNNIDEKGMGSYTASCPIRLTNGMKFSFSNAVEFNGKKVDIVDGKQMVYSVIAKDDSLCLYEIDVTDKQGWDKLQNPNNVYQVDTIERAEVAAFDLYSMGLPIDTELNKMVHVTHIKGHLVHTHSKECK